MDTFTKDILESWRNTEGNVNSYDDILSWITERIEHTKIDIRQINLSESDAWFQDDITGRVLNKNNGFFSIAGIKEFSEEGVAERQQPIIVQPEIGYLGMLVKKVDGVLNFLMQAKIEPGNLNAVQLSPTIQATKSNFTAKHGGKKPAYLDYFLNAERHHVVYDQIQSEQSARFYKKRNRNIIVELDEEIELLPNFRWMTLGQIKRMLSEPNLINMDTRTVISGIPFASTHYSAAELAEFAELFVNPAMYRSIFEAQPIEYLPKITRKMNDYKMFNAHTTKLVSLNELNEWQVGDNGMVKQTGADFSVGYFEVAIEGREITKWTQPLVVAEGEAELGLIMREHNGIVEVLVKLMPEIGAMDQVELGPTIQWESLERGKAMNAVEQLYLNQVAANQGILRKVMLSEEGGRFYHEQNLNIIMMVVDDEVGELPEEYIWSSVSALNYLIQTNNVLNIQLRNLLSMLDI